MDSMDFGKIEAQFELFRNQNMIKFTALPKPQYFPQAEECYNFHNHERRNERENRQQVGYRLKKLLAASLGFIYERSIKM
ncbi:unnamed protein product [Gongylonema pulchrum]|uniref:Uncharacterized protein n=1 Tax=Gongylonema pulchrum TaxID=637853 RepID=A0A3P6QEV8_9BILA|nr:unnamed protein product [Gongylonema pulchrum]